MKNEDISNTVITKDGIIPDISGGAEVPCTTCRGKGRIPDPNNIGKVIFYSHPNGDREPHITCRTCSGEGWVFKKS